MALLIKHTLDFIFALILIIITSPLLLIFSILIKLEDGGKVFFEQERVGKDRTIFKIIKFRSMVENAIKMEGGFRTHEKDSRITKIGHFLRKTSLDELPQLFNILKGDMSFIGPRPERGEFVERLAEQIPYYGKRHFIKPGVTGWAQVKYPYGATDEDALEKLRYDLYYIKNFSITLDLMIILETVKVVLFGRGGR